MKKSLAKKALNFAVKHDPDSFKSIVDGAATELTEKAMLSYMNKMGVRHCSQCFERYGLRYFTKTDGTKIMVCPEHHKKLKKFSAQNNGG